MQSKKNDLAKRVQRAIERSELSDMDIANKIGVSPTTVWRWRKGETQNFTLKVLRSIATALQIEVNALRGIDPKSDAVIRVEERLKTYESRVGVKGVSDNEREILLEFLLSQAESLAEGLRRLRGLERRPLDDG